MIRQILVDGDPILRAVSREVKPEELETPETQALIDDLVQTFKSANAAGLAAPQIGESIRIIVVDKPLTVLVNPVWSIDAETTDATDTSYEGCLSVPGMRGEVRRYQTVKVSGLDRHGKPMSTTWTKFRAIVLQHEVDHLDGILYNDRATMMYPDSSVHAPKAPAPVPVQTGAFVPGTKKTFVIESPKPVRGMQFVAWMFEAVGRVVDLRINPGGALVTGVWLSGVRLKAKNFKAGSASSVLLGQHGLHVAAGDQLRLELNMPPGKRKLTAEADFDG